MTLTLYDPDNVTHLPSNQSRTTREQGIGVGVKYRETGVKKVMILASSPKVSENFYNTGIFIDKVKLGQLHYKFTGDFKMLNIVAGIMSASARCPCVYCDVERVKGVWGKKWEMRTFQNIRENCEAWLAAGGQARKAKQFKSCVEKPLLESPGDNPETLLLVKMPPPALHCKLAVNHFLEGLGKVWPPVFDWLSSLDLVFEPYHGNTLEGNGCSKVLRRLDSLEEIIPGEFVKFVDCLKGFRDTVNSCFGFTLDPFYKNVIKMFKESFVLLQAEFGTSETNKLHVIFNHIEDFIVTVGKPLGEFSEQELENAHSAFEKIWARYKVKNLKSNHYAPNYLKAVLTFNAIHV